MNRICRAIFSTGNPLHKTNGALISRTALSYSSHSSSDGGSAAYRTTKYPPTATTAAAKKSSSSAASSSPMKKRNVGDNEWGKPKEIPYQPKIVNSVNIIGYVHSPLLSHISSDGNFSASTLLSNSHLPNSLRIPIVFEGDLAHVAACHLKENDYVYICGQLTPPSHPLPSNPISHPHSFQVMVHSVNFVERPKESNRVSTTSKLKDASSFSEVDQVSVSKSWKDLIARPDEWWDIRSNEATEGAAFERKSNGEVLRIDDTTPNWILLKLESIVFDPKPMSASQKGTDSSAGVTKQLASGVDHWVDLVDNPKKWWDYRSSKLNGSVKPKHPDFKHKDAGIALWCNKAPRWVLSKIEALEFDVPINKSGQSKVQKGEKSWKDLIGNPEKWWDNRLMKKNEKAPDFKHKDTGEALWLSDSPAWVLQQLPSPKTKKGTHGGQGDKLLGVAS